MQDRYIQMLTVAPFIMIVCMAIEICILFVEYKMLQSLKTKRSCKYQVVGKKLSYEEIPGRPTRYKIVVEYEVNGTSRKTTIHTADSGARRLEKEEKVFLRCSNNSDKVFWAEESDNSRIAAILILGIIAIVLLTIIVFAISGKLMQAY